MLASNEYRREVGTRFNDGLVSKDNPTFARCVVLLSVAPEIIEDTNQVAVKVGSHKLAQLPGFVLRFGNDLRFRGLPPHEEVVYLGLAVEIKPKDDRAYVAVRLSEGAIGYKESAVPS